MENIDSDLITILWIAASFVGIGLLVAGAERKIVIYFDGADMAVTGLAIFLPLAAWLLHVSRLFESDIFNGMVRWVLSPGLAIAGLACMIASFKSSIRHNRSITLGLLVGLFKIVFLTLTAIVVLGQMSKLTDEKTTFIEALGSILMIAACAILARAMINGPEVYAAKGWELSEFVYFSS